MRLALFVLLFLLGPLAAGQEEPRAEEPQQSEAPSPTVTVSPVGIVVITGPSKEPPAPDATEESDESKAEEGSDTAKDPDEATPEAESDTAESPKSRTLAKRDYDLAGCATPGAITISGHGTPANQSTTRLLRNSSGRDVPYLTEPEQALDRTTAGRVTERRTHRYDTAGSAVSQQLVRDQGRLMPDGSVQRVVTVYESDINGRMQPTERTTTVERKVGNTTRTTTTAERPALDHRFTAYRREQSVRTEQGNGSAQISTKRHVDNGAGRLIESEREESKLTRSGNVATTETTLSKRSVVNQDRFELASRSVGKLAENPDGSTSETIENTTTRSRSIADPSRRAGREVVRSVKRPTGSGLRIATHSYEEGFNGWLRATGSLVEEVSEQ